MTLSRPNRIIEFLGTNKFRVQLHTNTVDAVLPDHLIPQVLPYYQHAGLEKISGLRTIFHVTLRHRPKPALPQIIDIRLPA